jgi:tetraprenyl-beta-curcumene synthase
MRELGWGLHAVARESRLWRLRAERIPDMQIRRDALGALARKRGNVDGAALFWIIPRARNPGLLKLLVTYQIMWDFLDNVNETGARSGQANGEHLHRALVEALDPSQAVSDYYRYHPWCDDDGYLRSLVETCRECSRSLAYRRRVHPYLIREARRAGVQAINHDPDPSRRDVTLREWVAGEFPSNHEAMWFELAAGAGAGLTIYALLALGVENDCDDIGIARVCDAYFPWISALATMLDSYVDQSDDLANGDHVYLRHYSTAADATACMSRLIERSVAEARTLPCGTRHSVIVACMIAMYLSKDSAQAPDMRDTTAALLDAGGRLPKLLLPVLRMWRLAYAQGSN